MRKFVLSLSIIVSTWVSAEASTFEAGLGVVSINNSYRGLPTETLAFPLIAYQNGNFAIEGAEVSYSICDCQGFSIRSHLKPGFDFLDASKSSDAQIRALADRKISILAGLTVSKLYKFGGLSISIDSDVSGNSEGLIIEASLSKPMALSERITFVPSLAFAAINSRYANYYFGLKNMQDNLPDYIVGNSSRLTFSSTFLYKHSDKLSFQTSLSASRMSDEIASSPIVASANSQAFIVGAKYTF
jgi:outer membrane protein